MRPFQAKRYIRRTFSAGVVAFLLAAPFSALPQGSPAAPGALDSALSPDQLDVLVAPVALYPDPLLGQVLVSCTYPIEVVEAQQWLQRNHTLAGSQLLDAARQQNWDASVQALVVFPDVLSKLNQDIRWTNSLGNAFLAQQGDVMSAVQRMRARALANGKLYSTPQEQVTPVTENGQTVIQIVPADPQVVYVPWYDPMYIWGPPLWGYYPALYFPIFGYGFGAGINVGYCFAGWGSWGWSGWGWGPNWFGRSVFVNPAFFSHYGFRGGGTYFGRIAPWAHDPSHRMGVPYPNQQLANRFHAPSMASRRTLAGGQTLRPATPQTGVPSSRGSASRSYAPTPSGRSFGAGVPGAYGGGFRGFGAGPRSFGGGFGGASHGVGGGGGGRHR